MCRPIRNRGAIASVGSEFSCVLRSWTSHIESSCGSHYEIARGGTLQGEWVPTRGSQWRGRDRRVRRRSSCLRLVRACAWVIVTLLPCVLAIHLLVLINSTDKSGFAVKSVTALRKLRFFRARVTSHERSMLRCIGRPCKCSASCGDVGPVLRLRRKRRTS